MGQPSVGSRGDGTVALGPMQLRRGSRRYHFLGMQPGLRMHMRFMAWTIAAESSGCHGDHLTCRAENIYFLSLYRKCLPTVALKGYEGNDDLGGM